MPETQPALLEAMPERQVTVDGVMRPLRKPFPLLATENPIEQAHASIWAGDLRTRVRECLAGHLDAPDDDQTFRRTVAKAIHAAPDDASTAWLKAFAEFESVVLLDPTNANAKRTRGYAPAPAAAERRRAGARL